MRTDVHALDVGNEIRVNYLSVPSGFEYTYPSTCFARRWSMRHLELTGVKHLGSAAWVFRFP
jgi:hypothetical protein